MGFIIFFLILGEPQIYAMTAITEKSQLDYCTMVFPQDRARVYPLYGYRGYCQVETPQSTLVHWLQRRSGDPAQTLVIKSPSTI